MVWELWGALLLKWPPFFAATNDSFTTEFYANPVAIGDFEKHCAQRRKYPVLLQIEFNNATREDELLVSHHLLSSSQYGPSRPYKRNSEAFQKIILKPSLSRI